MDKQFNLKEDRTGYFMNQIWTLKFGEVKLILKEAHKSRYSIHPELDKMHLNLKMLYWWPNMKAESATYVGKCLTCPKVKAEYQKPFGLLQQPSIPE